MELVEVVGLRRVGKTTLFLQLINCLIEKKINPYNIWYFTFDEFSVSLDKLLLEFSKQTNVDFKNEKAFIFLDEIQKLKDFQKQIKVYYDLYPNLKFLISGSTSLFLKKKTQESLAGRIISFLLNPLDFEEYLLFRDKRELLEKPLAFSQEIEKEFEFFLTAQFIESIPIKNNQERKDYFISIIKKIIFEDIPLIFSVDNPDILWHLARIIGQKPGIIIDYRNLASELGISNKTVSLYLYYLQEAFLVKKLYNFSRNLITSEKKLKKFYLASPSFSWALTDFISLGFLVENLLTSLNNWRFFWRDAYKHEVDFIKLQNQQIIPIESKYKAKLSENDFKNIVLFIKKFNCSKAIFYNKTMEKRRIKKSIELKSIFQLTG